MNDSRHRVLSIPHGGGPLPLMGDPMHQAMVDFLKGTQATVGQPSAILLISAHWECAQPTLTSGAAPELIYDYGGFPPEMYQLKYPAPGSPDLANKAAQLLASAGFDPALDPQRGFDHGVFVPLLLMFPDAQIPVVQLSLLSSLDPAAHLAMGQAIAPLVDDNVLIVGSGFTFHNMGAFDLGRSGADVPVDAQNQAFEEWLRHTCTSSELSAEDRTARLVGWEDAPGARWSHPREEHLLPLHVCSGAGGGPADLAFDDLVLGMRSSGYSW